MASVIAMNDAKDTRKFKRTQREKIFEIGIMYMSLRRDLENEFKKLSALVRSNMDVDLLYRIAGLP